MQSNKRKRPHLKVFCVIEMTSATLATMMTAQKYSMLATRVECWCKDWAIVAKEI